MVVTYKGSKRSLNKLWCDLSFLNIYWKRSDEGTVSVKYHPGAKEVSDERLAALGIVVSERKER